MPGLAQPQVNQTVSENVNSKAKVLTDEFSSYFKLNEVIANHETHKSKDGESDKVMPWVHTAIANAKRNLLGIHHRVDGKYLQNYLNEFCYKVNRRNMKEKIFERLLIAVVTTCLCI